MASPRTSVVVWEWEDFPNVWLPYEVEAAHFIEGNFQSHKENVINLGQVHFRLACYELNLKNMTQTRIETGKIRQIRRTLFSTDSPPGQGISWEWHSDYDWVSYDIPTACILEESYLSENTHVDLSTTPLGIPNTVDLNNMEQVNNYTRTCRQVRRTQLRPYPQDSVPRANNSVVMLSTSSSKYNVLSTKESPTASTGLSTAALSLSATASSTALTTSLSSLPSTNFTLSSSSPTCTDAGKAALPVSTGDSTMFPPSHNSGLHVNSTKRKKLKKESSKGSSDPVSQFCSDVQKSSDEDCSICYDKLSAPSHFEDESGASDSPNAIKQLNKCKHLFHSLCLRAMYNNSTKDGSLQCPICKTIHGVKHGTQPTTGTMHVSRSKQSCLPGHPDCGIITVTYEFTSGKQGPGHPNPGKRFNARGFPRVCYLPDNEKGCKVLKLLKIAWDRRLIFAIGTSTTTGQQDTVVWNEIHHKTEAFSNHSGHGYPDPNYLDNVLAELAAHGVEDDTKN